MFKNMIIAILAGIAIVQRITSPGEPGSLALALGIAIMAFMVIIEMEDLWDKRQQIIQRVHNIAMAASKYMRGIPRRVHSRIRWHLIQLRVRPIETAQRQRRHRMMQEYIRQIQDTRPQEKGQNPEESEV